MREIKGDRAGENFVAITDPGTLMETMARGDSFRRIFLNPADIGGRYSALSYFGMVPAALQGFDFKTLLDRADRALHASMHYVPAEENPAARLGAVCGERDVADLLVRALDDQAAFAGNDFEAGARIARPAPRGHRRHPQADRLAGQEVERAPGTYHADLAMIREAEDEDFDPLDVRPEVGGRRTGGQQRGAQHRGPRDRGPGSLARSCHRSPPASVPRRRSRPAASISTSSKPGARSSR